MGAARGTKGGQWSRNKVISILRPKEECFGLWLLLDLRLSLLINFYFACEITFLFDESCNIGIKLLVYLILMLLYVIRRNQIGIS